MRQDTQKKVNLRVKAHGFATSKESGLSELHCRQQNFIVALVVVGHKRFALLQNNEETRTWRQTQFGYKVEDTLFIRMYVYCYYNMLKDYMHILRFGSRASCSLLQTPNSRFAQGFKSSLRWHKAWARPKAFDKSLYTVASIIKLLFIYYCCSGR